LESRIPDQEIRFYNWKEDCPWEATLERIERAGRKLDPPPPFSSFPFSSFLRASGQKA